MATEPLERDRVGHLLDSEPTRRLSPPTNPMAVARELIANRYTGDRGQLSLRHWQGSWWRWRTSHWVEIEERSVREDVYRFTEHASYELKVRRDMVLAPWEPTRHKIADVLDAMAAVCFLAEDVHQPAWIDDVDVPAGTFVACANGLLHVATRALYPHTPAYFNQTSVPFDFDPGAGDPSGWIDFLVDLFGEDLAAIDALGEWFGYLIAGRTDQHKILLLVGPTRAGKGLIAQLMSELVGRSNVAGPTLASLSTDFGLASLIDKPLAVVSDARLGGRQSNPVVERLLAISGEDTIGVSRKFRDDWTGQLPTRFVIVSNELPQLGDASEAIVGRFVVLILSRSWLGQEDTDLGRRLRGERTQILNWALDGLDRLDRQGRFTAVASSDDAINALRDLASPVSAFVREVCDLTDRAATVPVDELFIAWRRWAEDNGHRPGTAQNFGRNLRAVIPSLRVRRPGAHAAARARVFDGIRVRDDTSARGSW